MPIIEIGAASYSKLQYNTDAYSGHDVRLYFDEVPVMDGDGVFSFAGYTDAEHPTGWTLAEIWTEVFARVVADANRIPALTGIIAEMWETASGANVFMGIDAGDYTGIDGGTAQCIGSAYAMYVFKTQQRDQFRLTFFDTGVAEPIAFDGVVPPTVDDDEIVWFMCKSAVGFVNVAGEPLRYLGSFNTGYNDKLAESYGRRYNAL